MSLTPKTMADSRPEEQRLNTIKDVYARPQHLTLKKGIITVSTCSVYGTDQSVVTVGH